MINLVYCIHVESLLVWNRIGEDSYNFVVFLLFDHDVIDTMVLFTWVIFRGQLYSDEKRVGSTRVSYSDSNDY